MMMKPSKFNSIMALVMVLTTLVTILPISALSVKETSEEETIRTEAAEPAADVQQSAADMQNAASAMAARSEEPATEYVTSPEAETVENTSEMNAKASAESFETSESDMHSVGEPQLSDTDDGEIKETKISVPADASYAADNAPTPILAATANEEESIFTLGISRGGAAQSLNTGKGDAVFIPFGETITIHITFPSDHTNISNVVLWRADQDGYFDELVNVASTGTQTAQILLPAASSPYELMVVYDYIKEGQTEVSTASTSRNLSYIGITKVPFSVPTVTWSGYTASWSSTTTTNHLSGQVSILGTSQTETVAPQSYSYTVYRNGHSVATGTGSSVDILPIIASKGSGEYSVSVKAVADPDSVCFADSAESTPSNYHETILPVISDFSISSEAGVLSATVSDANSGVKMYAFSVADTAGAVTDDEKKNADSSLIPGTAKTYTSAVSEQGDYFFYAWDYCGNSVKSTDFVSCTRVDIHNYYADNVLTTASEYILTGQSKVLTLVPARTGYIFTGWYSDSELTTRLAGDTVTPSTPNVYAGWEQINLEISLSPTELGNSYNRTYTGKPVTITASVDSRNAEVSWNWVRKGTAISVSTTNECSFTDVADSGTYIVTASATVFNGAENIPVTNQLELTVNIEPVKLRISADNKQVTFGDLAPSYTYEVKDSFVNGETAESAKNFSVTLSCEYMANDAAKTYPIHISASAANYEISASEGTLTVNPLEISSTAEVTLSSESYIYDGSAKIPGVTIRNGGRTLSENTDYTLSYSADCVHAGNPSVEISFCGNYAGSYTKSFEIAPATLNNSYIALSGWAYDGTAHAPRLEGCGTNPEYPTVAFPSPDKITLHYSAAVIDASNSDNNHPTGAELSSAPKNAGTYCVWAVIEPENENYLKTTTPIAYYTIAPRNINIIADSRVFIYDGTTHTWNYWYVDDATPLIGTDSIVSVTVTGSARDRTKGLGVENIPSDARLSASALPGNYNITYQKGYITIGDGILPSPNSLHWDSSTPGMARWAPASADGVNIVYHAYLYRISPVDGTHELVSSDPAITEKPYYNFNESIKNDYKTYGTPVSYCFEVQSVADGGDAYENYQNSVVSASSQPLHTSSVAIVAEDGIASAGLTDGGADSVFLLNGESVNLSAVAETGYFLDGTVWTGSSSELAFSAPTEDQTNITTSLSKSRSITVTAHSTDVPPCIISFSATNLASGDNKGKVSLEFEASDTIGIERWTIVSSAVAPTVGSDAWNSTSSETSLSSSVVIDAAGEYYLYVTDGTTISKAGPIRVFSYTFTNGDAAATGAVAPILKAEELSVRLPSASELFWQDHDFFGWSDGHTLLTADSIYNEDSSTTFEARWQNSLITYRVNYYYETEASANVTSSVSYGTADDSFTSTGTAGTLISFSDNTLGRNITGFELDRVVFNADPNKQYPDTTGIVLTSANANIIDVYYKRSTYTCKFTCSGVTGLPERQYKYGALLTIEDCETQKPTTEGKTFSGWYYNNTLDRPTTMPAMELNVTGLFSANQVKYCAVYYTEGLDGTTYTQQPTLTVKDDSYFNGSYNFSTTSDDVLVKPIKGFTLSRISAEVYYNDDTPETEMTAAEGSSQCKGNFPATGTTYFKFFYTRNSYDLTVEVKKSPREANTIVFSYTTKVKYEDVPNFTPSVENYPSSDLMNVSSFADFETCGLYAVGNSETELWRTNYCVDDNENALDGYILAGFADWSTGSRPTKMPASDVSVVREYALDDEAGYTVRVMFAEAHNGNAETTWSEALFFSYAKTAGQSVTVGVDADNDISIDAFISMLPIIRWYDYENFTVKTNQPGDATVVYRDDVDHDPLEIWIYMERREVTATVNYLYDDGNTRELFATKTITSKWGEYFNLQALQFFDSTEQTLDWGNTSIPAEKVTAAVDSEVLIQTSGLNGRDFDFRTNAFAVNYSCGSQMGVDKGVSGSLQISDVEQLNKEYRFCVASSPKNTSFDYTNAYINVVYCKLRIPFVVDLYYSSQELLFGTETAQPLTVTINGTEYLLRACNKCDVIKNTVSYDAASEYPGMRYQIANAEYTYEDDTYINGFHPIEGSNYYSNESDGGNYAYFTVEDNGFFYEYGSTFTHELLTEDDALNRLHTVQNYKTQYETDHALSTVEPDERVNNIVLSTNPTGYNRAVDYENPPTGVYGGLFFSPLQHILKLTYDISYKLTHNLVSKNYLCDGHTFAAGSLVNPYTLFRDIDDPIGESARSGYTIHWYRDVAFAQHIDNTESIKLTEDTTVYGRYEKSAIDNRGYVLYQLSDGKYLTAREIDNQTGLTREKLGEETVTLRDTVNNKMVEETAYTYRYYRDGELAAVVKDIPTMTFSDISLSYEDYIGDANGYEHYIFASHNTSNWLKDYCQYDRIDLKAYVSRETYTLAESPNYKSKKFDVTISNQIWGGTITLPVYSDAENGYVFDGWKFFEAEYDSASDTWLRKSTTIDLTTEPVYKDDILIGYRFTMPTKNVYARAQWKAAVFPQDIIHYFPDADQIYNTTIVTSMRQTLCAGKEDTLSSDTFEITNAGSTFGYAVKSDVTSDGNYTVCYYNCTDAKDIGESYLIGAVSRVHLTNSSSANVNDYIFASSNFSFTNGIKRMNSRSTDLRSGEIFSVSYSMALEYYYSPNLFRVNLTESGYVSAAVIATDNGTVGSSAVSGAGQYYFKANCSLNVVLDKGYSLIGWFNRSDVISADDKYITTLTNDDLSRLNLWTGNRYSFRITGLGSYVALIRPDNRETPTVQITGVNQYIFGYEDGFPLTCSATFPADTSGYTVIEPNGYTWYVFNGTTWDEIEGAKTNTIPFETGKTVGSYTYKCKVTTRHALNGRTGVCESAHFPVTVSEAATGFVLEGKTTVYDATDNHTFTVCNPLGLVWGESSGNDIDVFYSETELTSASGGTKLTKEGFTGLRYTDAGTYKIWYYVQSCNPAYESDSAVSLATLQILPKTISIAAVDSLSKSYDGTDDLSGANATALAVRQDKNEFFDVIGLCDGDSGIYSITFDPELSGYNSTHAGQASMVTLCGLRLLRADGAENYTFNSGSSLVFAGRIVPRNIPLTWSEGADGFLDSGKFCYHYDASEHYPTASYSIGPVTGEYPQLVPSLSSEAVNAGNYSVTASLDSAEAAQKAGNYLASDYTLSNTSSAFEIRRKAIRITPVADGDHLSALTYDGKSHTFVTFTVEPALPTDFSFRATADAKYIHAGSYTISTSDEGLIILDGDGKEATDNFIITRGSETLIIGKRTVKISGLTAQNKTFDTTDAASPVLDGVIFGDVIEGDALTVSGIAASFDTKHVGTDKIVTLDYSLAVLGGGSAADYVIAPASSDGSQETTTAAIIPASIAVSFTAADVVYGQALTFVPTFRQGSDSVAVSQISGELSFTLNGKTVEHTLASAESSYSFAASEFGVPSVVSTAYVVSPDVSGLVRAVETVTNDYVFTADPFEVSVGQRPVSIASAPGCAVTKSYDETTDPTAANRQFILEDSWQLGAVSSVPESGIYASDTPKLDTFSACYSESAVGTSRPVTVSNCVLNDPNYVLKNTVYTIDGSITALHVTVTADEKTKVYGCADPVLTWTITDDSGVAIPNERLSGISASRASGDTVGSYTITPAVAADAENTNYSVTLANGSMSITKRTLTLTPAGASSVTYGDSYGTTPFSAFSLTVGNWAYSDRDSYESDFASADLEFVYGSGNTLLSSGDILDAATYTVLPKLTEASLPEYVRDNYTLSYQTSDVQVIPRPVTVTSGVTARDRAYDATTDAALDVSGAVFTGVIEKDRETVTFSLKSEYVHGTFEDKNQGSGKTVNLRYESAALQINGAGTKVNYTLAATGNQPTATATISPIDLHIKVNDVVIPYGTAKSSIPAFSVTYQESDFAPKSASASVPKDTAATALTGSIVYKDSGYTNTSASTMTFALRVDTDPDKTTLSALHGNYNLIFSDGVLSITPTSFPAPTLTWSEAAPGTITWNAVEKIGDVTVKEYSITLLRNGTPIQTVTVGADTSSTGAYSYDFAGKIHDESAGYYEVRGITVSTRPEDVKNSSDGTLSTQLYSADVNVRYRSDSATTAGRGSGAEIYLTAYGETKKDKLLLIAGETLTVSADIVNDTGYAHSISELTASKLTVGSGTVADAEYLAPTKLGFSLTLKPKLGSADTVIAEIAYQLRPATLDGDVELTYNGTSSSALVYGYKNDLVKITAAPKTLSDTVDITGYDYTAGWTIQDKYPARATVVSGVTDLVWDSTDSFLFPTGLKVPDAADPLYPVTCTITAKRKDNGETVTKTFTKIIPVERAIVSPTVECSSWTYGEERKYQNVPEEKNPGNAAVNWYYGSAPFTGTVPKEITDAWISEQISANGWITGRPTEAGTWYIFAYVRMSANFLAGFSCKDNAGNPTTITIHQAKLSAPTDLAMTKLDTSGMTYGKVFWNKVTTFNPGYTVGSATITNENTTNLSENNGLTSDSHTINVTYSITLSRDETVLYTWPSVSSTTVLLDITPYLTQIGTYDFEITALSSDTDNCLNSDTVTAHLDISKTIQAETHGVAVTEKVERVYDGTPTVLSIVETGNTGYRWFKDGVQVSSEATLAVTDASDAFYTCVVESGGASYSTSIEVCITKRNIQITADSDEKIYDGKPLTDKGFTITTGTDIGLDELTLDYSAKDSDGLVKSSLHTISLDMTVGSTQTDAHLDHREAPAKEGTKGFADNTIDIGTVSIMRYSADTADYSINVTSNYTITSVSGILTVAPKTLTDTAAVSMDTPANVTYQGTAFSPTPSVTYITASDTLTLAETTDYTYSYLANRNAGTATVTATGKGNYTGSISREFTIAPRNINDSVCTCSELPDVIYNGSSHKPEPVIQHTYADSTLYTLVKGVDVTIDWTSSKTTDTTITDVATITVTVAGIGNYTGTRTREFDIKCRPITITSDSASKTYDATALTCGTFSVGKHGVDENLAAGHTVDSAVFTGTVTQYADSPAENTFSDVVIKAGDKDVTENYDITLHYGTLTIMQKGVAAFLPNVCTQIYGEAFTDPGVTTTAAAEMLCDGDSLSMVDIHEPFEVTCSPFDPSNASKRGIGTYATSITSYAMTANASYHGSVTDGVLTVTARPITITPTDVFTKVFGGVDPTFTYTSSYTGDTTKSALVYDDTLAGALSRDEGESVGTYNLTIGTLQSSNPNYLMTLVTGTLQITQKDLADSKGGTIAVSEITNVTYNAGSQKAHPTVTHTKANGGTVTLTEDTDYTLAWSSSTGDTEIKDVAEITVTIRGIGNYTGTITRTYQILRKEATIRANNLTKIYGENDKDLTAVELATEGTDKLAYTLSRAAGEDVGSYEISVTPGSNPNYNVSVVSGRYTITKKPLIVKANDNTITYGDVPTGAGVTITGFVRSDDRSDLVGDLGYDFSEKDDPTVPYTSKSPTGGYAITPKGLSNANYTVEFLPGTLTVQNADITDYSVEQAAPLVYDATGQKPTLTKSVTTVNSESFEIAYSLTAGGPYLSEIPSFTEVGATKVYYRITADNHNSREDSFTVTVSKRPLILTGSTEMLQFTGETLRISAITATGLLDGHTHNAVYLAAGVDIGDYPGVITPADEVTILCGTEDVTEKYEITTTVGLLKIRPASFFLKVTAEDCSFVYDGLDHYLEKTPETNEISGVTTLYYSADGTQWTTDVTKVSARNITDGMTIYIKATNPNYEVPAETTAVMKILPCNLSFVGSTASMDYTGEVIDLPQIEITGLANGQKHNVTSTVRGQDVGEYSGTITAAADVRIYDGSEDVTANYNISTTPGHLSVHIGSLELKVSLEDEHFVYDGEAHSMQNAAVTNAKSGTTKILYSLDGILWTEKIDTFSAKTVPESKKIYVRAYNTNFSNVAETSGSLTIDPKPLTACWYDTDTFRYDGEEHRVFCHVDGLLLEDGIRYCIIRYKGTEIDDYCALLKFNGPDESFVNYVLPKNNNFAWCIAENPAILTVTTDGTSLAHSRSDAEVRDTLTATVSEDTNLLSPYFVWTRIRTNGVTESVSGADNRERSSAYQLTDCDGGCYITCTLTDALVDGEIVSKEMIYVDLVFTDGMGSEFIFGGTENGIFKTNGDPSYLDSVLVDGMPLSESEWFLRTTDGRIILNAAFLNTLSEGEHIIAAVYTDGVRCDTTFSVSGADGSTAVEIGADHFDSASPMLSMLLAFAVQLDYYRRKKKLQREIERYRADSKTE